MRASEFVEDNFGTHPRRPQRSGARPPRGHQPVERYRKVSQHQLEPQLNELSFLGDPCTVDCSGHRAGYDWYKKKQYDPASASNSFNRGAALAKAGR